MLLVICTLAVGLGQVKNATAADFVSEKNFKPHAGMLLYPDVSATHVVFLYANNLWTVPRTGGVASPLASPPGREAFPRFSPDGKSIAFSGNYEGNLDIYTIPVNGDVAKRITYHPASEILCDWTQDGRLLFMSNGLAGLRRQTQLFTVSPDGGMAQRLPVPYGANGAISPDGQWLAYTPHTRDMRTWKRYRGGMATNIWLYHLAKNQWKPITDWEGTDTLPMWNGNTVYYLSDQGNSHRLNIWAYNTQNNRREQITNYSEYDVKWPAMGPGTSGGGELVFQNGPNLFLLDLTNYKTSKVNVIIPGDRSTVRPKSVDASKHVQSARPSSTGKRVVMEARGDIWTVPVKNGYPRNLTRTSGVAERDASWSPDGRWIAYFSDATGEYELYMTQSDGKGETRQLTKNGGKYRNRPTWSPDSKNISFVDNTGSRYLYNIARGETKKIDVDPRQMQIPPASWSHDSSWMAFSKSQENGNGAIILYNVKSGEKHRVTSGMFNDGAPVFDHKGDYLFFASNRQFTSPAYEDLGTTFIYGNTQVLLAVPLRNDVASPLNPKSDEETWKKNSDKKQEAKKQAAKKTDGKTKKKPLAIDIQGFERRAVKIPVQPGIFRNLAVAFDGKLLYVRSKSRGMGGTPSIKIFDFRAPKSATVASPKAKRRHRAQIETSVAIPKESTVVDGVSGFGITADGKKLLVSQKGKYFMVAAAASQKLAAAVSTSDMNSTIDPKVEWKQELVDAWRIQRDFFYDPNMHGVDWPKIRVQYEEMLKDCSTREDVDYVLGEMIAELNVGHAYVRGGGDSERGPRVSVGMLGCDYVLANGAYKIQRIIEGGVWDVDARGPLSQPGIKVNAGDYLLAVNGIPVDTKKDPWAAFQGLAGKTITITVSKNPKFDKDARDVVVKCLSSETALRYRAWVEQNRAYVAKKTGGKVGYIHVPDTGINGQNELIRQFYGQTAKAALVIDERWNAGGQIPTRFIELLNRPVTNYWAVRDGKDWTWPPDSHQGPKCMLINGLAGSGGDAFPSYFRQAGVGKLIGMRTWGGLVGISGAPQLIDGGGVTSPTFAFYETDGTWGIEGNGVEPDFEVIDDPSKMRHGGDPQLDKAIAFMQEEIKRHPYKKPKRPAYPDRSGMGIKESDK